MFQRQEFKISLCIIALMILQWYSHNAVLAGEPDSPELTKAFTEGFLLMAKGKHPEAIAKYTEALKLAPKNWSIYQLRGHEYLQIGQYEPAMKDFSELINADPNAADAYSGRSQCELKLNMLSAAVADMTKVAELNKDECMVYADIAEIQIKMGQYQKAIETCQAGIKVNPWSEHYCQMADAYIHLKKYQEAVKACDEGIKLDSESNHPRSLRKEALAAMGQK